MRLSDIAPMFISMILLFMTTTAQGQPHPKKTLVLQLSETYKWTSDSFDDDDTWGFHHKGFIGTERFPSINVQQTNMLNQQDDHTIPQLMKQIKGLVKSYDNTAKLKLQRQGKVEGDNSYFYTITLKNSTLLLFYRQSKQITHAVEIELHADQLEQITLAMWEKSFFNSIISD